MMAKILGMPHNKGSAADEVRPGLLSLAIRPRR